MGHQLKPARHNGMLRDVEAAWDSVNIYEEVPCSGADLRARVQANKMERHIPPKIAILVAKERSFQPKRASVWRRNISMNGIMPMLISEANCKS